MSSQASSEITTKKSNASHCLNIHGQEARSVLQPWPDSPPGSVGKSCLNVKLEAWGLQRFESPIQATGCSSRGWQYLHGGSQPIEGIDVKIWRIFIIVVVVVAYMCHVCTGACRSQKRVSHPLALELWLTMSHLM